MTASLLARVQANVPVGHMNNWLHGMLQSLRQCRIFYGTLLDGTGQYQCVPHCGDYHPQYAGMTWLELLERGKRMTSISRYSKRIRDITRRQSNRCRDEFCQHGWHSLVCQC